MSDKKLSARASIRIHAPAADVFSAFVDADRMRRFWFHREDGQLAAGKPSTWFLGDAPDAYSFEVNVRKLVEPRAIQIEWQGPDGRFTQVTWSIDACVTGDTVLTIEETGFAGEADAVVSRVIDSTCGFNQVVVAAKAFIEHRIAVNVVNDHA